MSCSICGEDNKLFYCERCDCDICDECIINDNLYIYCSRNDEECNNKEDCNAYKYYLKVNDVSKIK